MVKYKSKKNIWYNIDALMLEISSYSNYSRNNYSSTFGKMAGVYCGVYSCQVTSNNFTKNVLYSKTFP